MKAIIYTRHSPQRHGDKSESCEVQAAYCEEHAAKKGWTVAGAYEDKNRSGADEKRPGLWTAIKQLSKDDVLLVFKYDRLARNVYLMEYIKRAVEICKARIEAVEGHVKGDDAASKMIRVVLSAFSEYEREMIAVRTAMAMKQHQRNGKVMSSRPPYGYKIDGKLLVPVKKEQAIIQIIEALKEEDPLEIVRTLNADGFSTRTGRPWVRRDVERVLSNLSLENKNG